MALSVELVKPITSLKAMVAFLAAKVSKKTILPLFPALFKDEITEGTSRELIHDFKRSEIGGISAELILEA